MTQNHKERSQSGLSYVARSSYRGGTKSSLGRNLSVDPEIKIAHAATKQEREL